MVIRMMFVALTMIATMIPATRAMAISWPHGPDIKAKAWVLLDARSGQILAQHNKDLQLPPASLTKMMTLYIAFEDIKLGRLKLDEKVQVSKKAWKMGGSRMFIEPRKHPTVLQLLRGISTDSGNDATVALAEHIAGSESAFADIMNQKAKELGLTHTHYNDSTGFPTANHYSTAHDLALLGAALWRNFPKQYKLFSEKSFTYNGITQSNRNRLLWSDPDVDGIKTGHTKAAGYCLVSSAQKGNTRLVSAVLGTASERAREWQSHILLNYGFRNFTTIRPAEHDIRRRIEVYQGKQDHVWLLPAHPVWISVPKGYAKQVRFHLKYKAPLRAPIKKGERIGTIEAVLKDGKNSDMTLASVAMKARSSIPRASWLGRKWDALKLWWNKSDEEAEASDKQ
ncbi:MAG TPA: D-alanyl-D-alanine carboxypeptidase family protein [Mariprofundaceae bacterium]|nr:D-alanyl-D-alanine carboxypeptidase family protein [Mariprofundaceae bacterium]